MYIMTFLSEQPGGDTIFLMIGEFDSNGQISLNINKYVVGSVGFQKVSSLQDAEDQTIKQISQNINYENPCISTEKMGDKIAHQSIRGGCSIYVVPPKSFDPAFLVQLKLMGFGQIYFNEHCPPEYAIGMYVGDSAIDRFGCFCNNPDSIVNMPLSLYLQDNYLDYCAVMKLDEFVSEIEINNIA